MAHDEKSKNAARYLTMNGIKHECACITTVRRGPGPTPIPLLKFSNVRVRINWNKRAINGIVCLCGAMQGTRLYLLDVSLAG